MAPDPHETAIDHIGQDGNVRELQLVFEHRNDSAEFQPPDEFDTAFFRIVMPTGSVEHVRLLSSSPLTGRQPQNSPL
jgi:hypothetical protein